MKHTYQSAVKLVAGIAVAAILAIPTTARAAYTESFDALRAELSARAGTLTGSLDKIEQKQGKGCLKIIASIDKSTTLANDIKTAGKVAKSLAKLFPDDFLAPVTLQGSLVWTNLATLLDGALSNLIAEVQADLDALQTDIDALPTGPAKDSAQALHDSAQTLLNQAGTDPDFALAAKAIASSLKTVVKAANVVIKATSGGGGGGGQGLSCQVNGSSFNAIGAAGTFVNITGQFTVTGATAQRAVTIIASGVTGPGTYAAIGGTQVQEVGSGVLYTGNLVGTITITTLNLAQQKATGTFSFSATQTLPSPSTNSVDVTSGTFNISTIAQF